MCALFVSPPSQPSPPSQHHLRKKGGGGARTAGTKNTKNRQKLCCARSAQRDARHMYLQTKAGSHIAPQTPPPSQVGHWKKLRGWRLLVSRLVEEAEQRRRRSGTQHAVETPCYKKDYIHPSSLRPSGSPPTRTNPWPQPARCHPPRPIGRGANPPSPPPSPRRLPWCVSAGAGALIGSSIE